MSEAGHIVAAQGIKGLPTIHPSKRRSQGLMFQTSRIIAASKKNDFPQLKALPHTLAHLHCNMDYDCEFQPKISSSIGLKWTIDNDFTETNSGHLK
ncbi:hypothetical protein D5086_015012 [Populus alba]|uniref:Uncharacterized protein n=1 Tax=Populus alba TaxID=43335 RepID=A0ACC4C0C8_POPAL